MKNRVLVVDDEDAIVRLVSFNLEKAGYEVSLANDGHQALQQIHERPPDVVLLDIMLPGLDGYEICRQIRAEGIPTAVIMLSAKDEEIDKVLGLELGADDYISKPFSPRELVARVKAVLRRTASLDTPPKGGMVRIGDLSIDAARYEVSIGDNRIELTAKEFELLYFLAKNPGRVLTRDALLDEIWGFTFAGDTRIVDVHISHLRDKIETNPKVPLYIKTVRGVGYKFREP